MTVDLLGQQVIGRSIRQNRMKDVILVHVGDLEIAVWYTVRYLPVHVGVLRRIDPLRQPFRVVQEHLERMFHVRLETG